MQPEKTIIKKKDYKCIVYKYCFNTLFSSNRHCSGVGFKQKLQ